VRMGGFELLGPLGAGGMFMTVLEERGRGLSGICSARRQEPLTGYEDALWECEDRDARRGELIRAIYVSFEAARLLGTTLARSSLCRFLDLQSPRRTEGFTSGQRYLAGIRRLDPLGWPGCLQVAPS
jgi:hypothetical protein